MPVSAERQPGAGPEIRYKLRLFERLTGYSQSLLDSGAPAPISRGNRKFESISLQGLCAKIGLFQSSRSVFVQASISARKPIAGESNHALSASGGLARHAHRRSRRPEHVSRDRNSARSAARLRRIVWWHSRARCPRTVLEHRHAQRHPGFDFHAMRGTPRRYSIHVNGPWGITFES